MPRAIGSTATCSTWRSISPPGGAGSWRSPRRCGAGSRICSASRSTIEPLTEVRDATLTWYVGLDADAHPDRRHAVERRGARRGHHGARGRAVSADASAIRAWSMDKVKGEPVYLILAMTRDKMLRMKPQNLVDRPADPPSGGGRHERRAPLVRIPVGVVVERSKAASPWIDFIWRPVAVLPGQPETPPWTVLADDGERDDASMPAPPRSNCTARRPPTIATISRIGSAAAVGGAAADRRRSAVRAGHGDGRSGRRRGHDRSRQRPGRDGADARAGARDALRPSSPSTMSRRCSSSASAIAPIRKRWRAAARSAETEMSDPENFLARWSRRKREPADEEASAQPRAGRLPMHRRRARHARQAGRTRPQGEAPAPEFDVASCRRSNSITRRADIRAFLRRACPALDPCGPSPRVERRPGDPRFRRARRERVGLHRPNGMPGFGPLARGDPKPSTGRRGVRRRDRRRWPNRRRDRRTSDVRLKPKATAREPKRRISRQPTSPK